MNLSSSTSCQPCRTKKIKCTRELPRCQKCTKLNRECIYREKLRTGPKRRKLPIEIIEQQKCTFKANIRDSDRNISKKQQELMFSNMNLFEIIPLPILKIQLDRLTNSNTGIDFLGLTQDYILKLSGKYQLLLLTGLLTLSCTINLDFNQYEHNLRKCFEYQFTLLDLQSEETTNEYIILELLQSNVVNIHLCLVKFKTALIGLQLSESSEILQQFNYTVIDLVIDTTADSKNIELMEIKSSKRRVYWMLYKIDKVCSIAMGLSCRIDPRDHYVDLPDSRLNFNNVLQEIFDKDDPDIHGKLTIDEYEFIMLFKGEEVLLWCRELIYLKKTNNALKMKKEVMEKHNEIASQINRLEKSMKVDLKDKINTFAYFTSLGFPLVTLKAILSQIIVELYPCSTSTGSSASSSVSSSDSSSNLGLDSESTLDSNNLKEYIIELLTSIKDDIHPEKIRFYQSHPYLIFFIFQYMKVSLVYKENKTVSEINSMFLNIASKLTSDYGNVLGMELESECDKNKDSELSTWIFHKT